MFEIAFDHAWLAGKDFPRERGRALLRLLEALARAASLRDAARNAGLSYRNAWGLLGDAAQLFGAPLAEMQRGKPARLSRLGRSVLAADERVRAALGAEFERLRAEIPPLLAEALPGARPRLTIHASHDLGLEPLRALCASALELEIVVRGADESLAALARGECDLAGFHVARMDASHRASVDALQAQVKDSVKQHDTSLDAIARAMSELADRFSRRIAPLFAHLDYRRQQPCEENAHQQDAVEAR